MEDSLGTYSNLLMALTFLGVLYLVLKRAKINVKVHTSSEGKTNYGTHQLRYNTVSDSQTHRGWN